METTNPRAGWYRRVSFAFSLGLAVAAFYFLVRQAGIENLLAAASQLSFGILSGAIVIYAAGWMVRVWRLQRLLAMEPKHLSGWALYRIQIAGFAINSLFPAKMGDVAMITFLRSAGVSGSRALAAIFQTRVLDFLALLVLMIMSGITLLGGDAVPWRWPHLCGAIVLSLSPMALVNLDRRHYLEDVLNAGLQRYGNARMGFVFRKVLGVLQAYRSIASNPWMFMVTSLNSLFLWLAELAVTAVICLALGVSAEIFPWLFLAVPFANMAKALPLTPGGIGVYEGILATTLVSAGLPWEQALLVGILDHLLKKAWTTLWGVPLAWRLSKQSHGWWKQRREQVKIYEG